MDTAGRGADFALNSLTSPGKPLYLNQRVFPAGNLDAVYVHRPTQLQLQLVFTLLRTNMTCLQSSSVHMAQTFWVSADYVVGTLMIMQAWWPLLWQA